MGVYPQSYTKAGFIQLMEEKQINEDVIFKFKMFPETIKHDNSEYKLNIVVTFYSVGETFYNYELNYYSPDNVEFMFPYKIFRDITSSVEHLSSSLSY